MRVIDINNVFQHARVAEQAQTQMQHAQEFAQVLLADEAQSARQAQLNSVRDVKDMQNPVIESDVSKDLEGEGRLLVDQLGGLTKRRKRRILIEPTAQVVWTPEGKGRYIDIAV